VTSGATGKVTFYDGVTPLGIGTVSGDQASMKTVLLQSGTRSLHAYYGGDSTYAASTSAALSQTVVPGVSLGFQPAVLYSSPLNVVSMAVGDFDGDGNPDLAVTDSSGVSVLRGKGDGTFKAAVLYSAGTEPQSVVVGDFNGDGIPDLAAVSPQDGKVYVLLGNGDGTFQTALSYTAGTSPVALAVGDFNRDGKMDLAVVNNNSSNVSILLGNGDGTFQPAANYALGFSYPYYIAVGDLTGRGYGDLAVETGSDAIVILLGNGDGTFQVGASYATGIYPYQLAAGDFKNNGNLDLAVAAGWDYYILLGNGDGTFQAPVMYDANYGVEAIVVGDFNGDGKLDLAVTGYYSEYFSVLQGNGDGTFQSAVSYTESVGYGTAVVTADFNHDGKADLVIGGGSGLSVSLGGALPDLVITQTQNGGLTEGQQLGSYTITVSNNGQIATVGAVGVVATIAGQLTPVSIAGTGWTCTLATLTCTRSDSLAVGASYLPITVKFSVSNTYTGNVTSSASVSGGSAPANNTASNTAFVRLATTTGLTATPNPCLLGGLVTLTATVTSGATGKVTFFAGTTPLGVATLTGTQAVLTTVLLPSGHQSLRATYNGDSNYGPSTSAALPHTVTATLTNGFQHYIGHTVDAGPNAIAVADFNGDGKPDLITANNGSTYNAGTVSVLLGNGNGTFQTALTQAAAAEPSSIVVGDFNGDGYPDVAVSSAYGVYVLLGKGDGTFQNAVAYGAPPNGSYDYYTSLAVSDFNGDGKLDLLALSSGNIVLFAGNGDGTFQPPVTVYSGTGSTYFSTLAVADVNGDGKPDLVGINGSNSGYVYVLLGNGDGTFQAPVATTLTGVGYLALVVGDFNGDSKPDIAVVSWDGIEVALGNGDGTFGTPISSPLPVTNGSYAIAGDFNGDGKLDIAVSTCCSNNTFYITFGNGDGTFAPGAQFSTNSSAALALADFNGDGRLDLAATDTGSSTADVFLGAEFSGLNITSTHASDFAAGQTGTYQIVVTNPAFLTTTGTVTVTDTLPTGLTATAISGTNWTCTLSTLTCTRTDGLLYDNSYQTITIAVNVSGSLSASTIGNQVSVVNGAFMNEVTDPTVIVIPPAVHIDSPVTGSTVSGTITVSGWAIDNASFPAAGIGNVLVLVDGTAVGDATYGVGRPDVCITYPGRPNCPNVGFVYQLNTGLLTLGQHTITVSATDIDVPQETTTSSVTVTVVLEPAISSLSPASAAPGGTVLTLAVNGTSFVSGATVDWNGTALSTTFVGATQLTASVPATLIASAGMATVTVVNPGAVTSGGVGFTIQSGPEATAVSPGAGNGASQTFTFTFSDPAGYQNLGVLDVLINNYLDGIQACYIALVPSGANAGTLYLVDDGGDAGGPFAGYMALPGTGSVSNSQCTVSGTGSSVVGSGTTITLTLNIGFSASFTGNRIFYTAARDTGTGNSGWQALSTWQVPAAPATPTQATGVTPASGSGASQSFVFTFADSAGWQDLGVVDVLFNNFIDGIQGCYIAYSVPSATLYLVDDGGDAGGPFAGYLALPGTGSMSNSQCTVSGVGSSAAGSGNTLTLTLNISFSSSFAGNRIFYTAAGNAAGTENSGWQALGAWTVP
jgi:uncharacterized repeat protein (TIGR01451 family)